MNPVKSFADLLGRQVSFLMYADSRDQRYLDLQVDDWGHRDGRRGWTRQDLNRVNSRENAGDPETFDPGTIHGRLETRVLIALRIFNLMRPVMEARSKAVEHCRANVEHLSVATIVADMTVAHRNWLRSVGSGGNVSLDSDEGEVWRDINNDLWDCLDLMTEDEPSEHLTHDIPQEHQTEAVPKKIAAAKYRPDLSENRRLEALNNAMNSGELRYVTKSPQRIVFDRRQIDLK